MNDETKIATNNQAQPRANQALVVSFSSVDFNGSFTIGEETS